MSDSGEGAQRCGQSLGSIAARMGNGIWTTEIIPAEIRPPARSVAGASGNRIRIGSGYITNGGDETDLVVAFNEQVLLGRVRARELKPGCIIFLENLWRKHPDLNISMAYVEAHDRLVAAGYKVIEFPMEQECKLLNADPKRGKNMFALGMLCYLYSFDLQMARDQIALTFGKKAQSIIDANVKLLEAGHQWGEANLDFSFCIPATPAAQPQIVTNGNTALALGVMASGMELCSMYPITPATSASHYLSEVFEKVGGIVHQAEDEIAACAFAIGASYASKCTVTITSGPGYSLKQEAIGLAVMAEIPLVVVNVQRGGPSTGQPTKVEQGDLMCAIFGSHGDAPKVVMAPATIEDCFYSIITARKIAEAFNMVVVVLTDASLSSSQQPFTRPQFNASWLAPPFDQSPVPRRCQSLRLGCHHRPGAPFRSRPAGRHAHRHRTGARPRQPCGLRPRHQPGSLRARSLKLAALQKTLTAPEVFGEASGDLLVVGWGSTKGVIEEAVASLRSEGRKVSSIHLRFLQPMQPGIKEIMQRFGKVMTIETNWSDSPDEEIIDESNRRYSSLATLLRSRCLIDVDCWSEVRGQPIKPSTIRRIVLAKLIT
ncbi:2-oxoacid:acceptor oxidoreductase family protein [Propionivibrio sp.]|uniref:2-oxoacid:acceptor oxidoreductase family protein n=1 Tax=Propionivibrio sp. TaxID=2212460 RepID=UPI0025E3A816|nr:2-oxoacid:acceptor oxidoreductase family protein [Propionivibrio sp.]